MSESCGTCRFWATITNVDPKFGRCRRNPPAASTAAKHSFGTDDATSIFLHADAVWPVTAATEWCGACERGVPIDPPADPAVGQIFNDGMVWAWLGDEWRWLRNYVAPEFH